MFFRKKTKATQAPWETEHRAQYRKSCSKSQPLEATLCTRGSEPLKVELIDLTVRGAGIRVPYGKDRRLKVDEVVELRITSLMRNEIITGARVANVGSDADQRVRYGLQFLNLGSLYSQLDAFYARHFNRRQSLRVRPSLDRKLKATLRWEGGELRAQVYDLSETGIGVVLSKSDAERLGDLPAFDVAFKLSDGPECRGRALPRHKTSLFNQILLGLQFDVEPEDGMRRHFADLRHYVEQRQAEIELWEKSWG